MSNVGDDRSQATVPPDWWLELFEQEHGRRLEQNSNAKLAKQKPAHVTDTVGLGKLLAKIIGRESGAWNHSAVSNFINGKRYTREMAEAFSLLYGLPRFEVLLRVETKEKAMEMEMLLGRHDLAPSPAVPPRVAEVDQLAAALMESAEDQIAPVKSTNERTDRSGRSRRAARRS